MGVLFALEETHSTRLSAVFGWICLLSLHSTEETQPGPWLAPHRRRLQAGPAVPARALPTASASRPSPWRDARRSQSPSACFLLRTLIALPGGGRENAQNPPCAPERGSRSHTRFLLRATAGQQAHSYPRRSNAQNPLQHCKVISLQLK